jgi:hypothetical protein
VTTTFGSEPNPGIDKDPKVYILLLNIKDGFDPAKGRYSYAAGYFDPENEYQTYYSNKKEMLYMDTYPALTLVPDPGHVGFFSTLAHEFQHLVHWAHKTNDPVWLNEAMSEIAPVYCGYGSSSGRIRTFEQKPTDSLTSWNSTVADYGVAYMWAQYMKDRFAGPGQNIFKSMLESSKTGISSVNAALGEIDTAMTFTTTFNDWGIALYSGNTRTWEEHPEWSYTTISAATGSLFTATVNTGSAGFRTPSVGGFAFYNFAPLSEPTGTVTWTAKNLLAEQAVLIDEFPSIRTALSSGQAYTFTTAGYLIVSNPVTVGTYNSGNDTVVHTSLFESVADVEQSLQFAEQEKDVIKTPREMLDEADNDPHVKKIARETGAPTPVCIHPYFKDKEKKLKIKRDKSTFVTTERR